MLNPAAALHWKTRLPQVSWKGSNTPPMHDLLERASRGLLTEAAFEREALALARAVE